MPNLQDNCAAKAVFSEFACWHGYKCSGVKYMATVPTNSVRILIEHSDKKWNIYILEIMASWKWEYIFTTHKKKNSLKTYQQHNPINLLRNLNFDI